MSSRPLLVRSVNLREIGWPVWLSLALAVAAAVIRASQLPSITGPLAVAAPFLFAAAVFYVRPSERLFTYGAAAIALWQTLVIARGALPGAWIAELPILLELQSVLVYGEHVALVAGLLLIGVALGGVESPIGWLVITAGAVGAAIGLWSVLTVGIQDPVLLVLSLATVATYGPAWAFMFAAALDSRKPYFATGSGLLFAVLVGINYFVLLLPPFGPETDFGLIQIVVGALAIIGWLAMAVAALRGEVTGDLTSQGTHSPAR